MTERDETPEQKLSEKWAKLGTIAFRSPKQISSGRPGSTWYRYYAGYADAFVQDVVRSLPTEAGLVLDPWNGSGTTTSVAANHGVDAVGTDLNPAAVVVAKARLLATDVADSIVPLTDEVLATLAESEIAENDLLLSWFDVESAQSVRRLAETLRRALVSRTDFDDAGMWCGEISSLAALFHLGLFRVVRDAMRPFMGTNPTWVRLRVRPEDRVEVDGDVIVQCFRKAMVDLAAVVEGKATGEATAVRCSVGASNSIQLGAHQAAAVITSPPYCTRIDYAVATLPELAALGIARKEFRRLRERLIGTPTVGSPIESDDRWGQTAEALLRDVAAHRSRASAYYYTQFFRQYLAGMLESLEEINRVLASSGAAVLVVQDSYYKEVHVDVPRILSEMATTLPWSLVRRTDFEVRTKADMNGRARLYRNDREATESVLLFARA